MITLKSNNEKLSWIISKNPQTQLDKKESFSKTCRKGVLHGWYSDEQTFSILFVDHPTEMSFSGLDYEYLDKTRYCSPYLPVAAISEMLRSAMASQHEFDTVGYTHELKTIISLPGFISASRLASHMPVDISLTELSEGSCVFEVTFTTDKSIFVLLNAVSVWCVIQAVGAPGLYIPMDEAACAKYARAMNNIGAPYYARHVLVRAAFKSASAYREVKPLIENEGQFRLGFGDTQQHRFSDISQELPSGASNKLYDIGCGELYYSKKMARQYQSIDAFDANESLQAKNAAKLASLQIGNISLFGAANSQTLCMDAGADALLTEVIEHMPMEESRELLKHLASQPFGKLVITVPNRSFNPYYLLEDGCMRHWDHHWEPNEQEFESLIKDCFGLDRFEVQIKGCGDAADGVYASLMAVVLSKSAVNAANIQVKGQHQ